MRIAIIGAGMVGRGLAKAALSCRHDVVLAARHRDHAAKAADEVVARAAASAEEAVQGADVVVLAVPSTAIADVCDEIRRHIRQTVVIDPSNPLEPDPALVLEARMSVAEEVAILLPEARVVKASNTVLGARLTDPVVHGVRLDGFYAGDDPEAAVVAGLVAATAFRPLDVGACARLVRSSTWPSSTSASTLATGGRGRPAGSCSATPGEDPPAV
jgi:predicted dinucleotide-binding enzyme